MEVASTDIKAFVLLRPCGVTICDSVWSSVFKVGTWMFLPGGIEVHEISREDGFIYVRVRGEGFPPVRCRLPRDEANLMERVRPKTGRTPRVKICSHDKIVDSCLGCWFRWWKEKAREHGIEWGGHV